MDAWFAVKLLGRSILVRVVKYSWKHLANKLLPDYKLGGKAIKLVICMSKPELLA